MTTHDAKKRLAFEMACDFYRVMPGAPPVPLGADGWMWGEVESNEHFQFCETIAERIIRWSGRVVVDRD